MEFKELSLKYKDFSRLHSPVLLTLSNGWVSHLPNRVSRSKYLHNPFSCLMKPFEQVKKQFSHSCQPYGILHNSFSSSMNPFKQVSELFATHWESVHFIRLTESHQCTFSRERSHISNFILQIFVKLRTTEDKYPKHRWHKAFPKKMLMMAKFDLELKLL